MWCDQPYSESVRYSLSQRGNEWKEYEERKDCEDKKKFTEWASSKKWNPQWNSQRRPSEQGIEVDAEWSNQQWSSKVSQQYGKWNEMKPQAGMKETHIVKAVKEEEKQRANMK